MIAPPATLAPPAPFPLIVAQAGAPEFVAPGISRVDYRLRTSDGPLVVHVVAVDPSAPGVRLGVVVSHDRMISPGETVSSMARRTNAVAGINADYFDITNTNQPLNVVVRDGVLERTPSKRAAIEIDGSGGVAFGALAFAGSVSYGAAQVPLTTVNEWPPQGGAGLLTPAYGALTAAPNVTLARLAPLDAAPGAPGTYRVTAVEPATAGPVAGIALGFGPAALKMAAPPSPGDTVQLAYDTTPPLAGIAAAVGGGPLLVESGAPAVDPQSPAPEESAVRFPVAGALREADGTVLFVVVDGRNAAVSIGLTRPQFAALMIGLGATDGMAFDSGGSATLVARVLGDAEPTVRNDPSDGIERPVADGLFAYSDAPVGDHPYLFVRPGNVAALPGASVPLAGAIVDDAGHRLGAAPLGDLVADVQPGDHIAVVRDASGAYTARVPYRTVDRLATLALTAQPRDPAPGEHVRVGLFATDANGDAVAVRAAAERVRWTLDGAPAAGGDALALIAPARDVVVTATLAGASATLDLPVGSHVVAVGPPLLALAYDLTGSARAVYAPLALPLPGEPLAFALDVLGDGAGVVLRAQFTNRYGERRPLTLAAHVDWQGWRHLQIALPPDLNPPVALTSLYVVPTLGGPPVRAAGTLQFRALSVVVPGTN